MPRDRLQDMGSKQADLHVEEDVAVFQSELAAYDALRLDQKRQVYHTAMKVALLTPKPACSLYPTASSAWEAVSDVAGPLLVAVSPFRHEHH